jgi:glucokinase
VTRIGIDVGGTKCLAVALDDSHKIVHSKRVPTPDGSQLVAILSQMVRDIVRDVHGVHAGCDVDDDMRLAGVSVGIGLPGAVGFNGVFHASPHIANVSNIPVAALLGDALGISVVVDNDATAATFAEWTIGAARGTTDAVMVTLGTGIGGGVVMGGQLQRGAHGYAGEFGHFVVERGGNQCACGQRGCWETYASGSALRSLSGGVHGVEVMTRAQGGDVDAVAVVESFSDWVALGVGALVNMFDPAVVVIGGGVVESGSVFIESVSSRLSSYVYGNKNREIPSVVPALLGEKAGAIGSALLGALQ